MCTKYYKYRPTNSGSIALIGSECPQGAHLLYKIIASRNQKHSTALVTNVDFDKWGEYLSDGPLAMAFLDRLVEGAIILKVKGKSYRASKTKGSDNNQAEK
jgi:DNA replication protein DnaC